LTEVAKRVLEEGYVVFHDVAIFSL